MIRLLSINFFCWTLLACNAVFKIDASSTDKAKEGSPANNPAAEIEQNQAEETETGPLQIEPDIEPSVKTADVPKKEEDVVDDILPNPINLAAAPPAKMFQSAISFSFSAQTDLAEYRYVLRSGSFADCAGVTYSNWFSMTASFSFTDTDLTEGARTLCLEGRTSDGKIQETPTVLGWERAAGGLPNWSTWTKQTPSDAFLKASPSGTDTNQNINEDSINRLMRTGVFNNKIVFTTPCKAGTGGRWNLCLATWDGVAASAEWIDNDVVTAGHQPLINSNSLTDVGTIVGNHIFATGYKGPGNKFYGFGIIDRNALGAYKSYTFVSDTPESFAATSYELGTQGTFEVTLSDSSWQGATDRAKTELMDYEGLLYFYRITTNAPTSDNHYISVVTSADGTTFTAPTDYILSGYSRVFVASHGISFHMIAQDRDTKVWYYIPGASPSEFDNTARYQLDLDGDIAGSLGWDSVYYKASATSELKIVGMESLNGKLYVFYLAGDFDFPGAPPLNGGRGLGYFSVNLQ